MALSLGQTMANGLGFGGNKGPSTPTPSTPGPNSTIDGHGPANGQWEQHPIYIALSSRMSATENAVSALSNQVTHLQDLITKALPTVQPSLHDQQQPLPPARPVELNRTTSDPVAALTQQISALSTSVAQLQRLQSQTNLTRQQSSRSDRERERGPGNGPGQGQGQGLPPLSLSPAPPNIYNTEPLTAPHSVSSPPFTPKTPFNRDYLSRPQVSRSISSTITTSQQDQDKTWAPPLRTPGTGMINRISPGPWPTQSQIPTTPGPGSNNATGNGNGGLMSPSVMGPGVNGAGAPGAGIVVTKWDHLNLKPDLVRSIQKYGIGPPNKIQARVLPFMLKGSDIIAQAPPTQERIISYIIPAIHQCMSIPPTNGPYRGPSIIIVTTTVDQATQAHKLIRNVGGPLGVRAALATGVVGSSGLPNELATMQRDAVNILIGTPAKVTEVMTTRGGLQGGEVRTLILDEVDQLIARNLYSNVLNLVKVLPSPRHAGNVGTPGGEMGAFSPGIPLNVVSPYDAGRDSPFNPASQTPFPGQSRFGPPGQPLPPPSPSPVIERQTCIFSNTIPTDVINFSQTLQVRDPVRVLVRREGSTNSQESVSSVTPGINLKHTYVYLTITGSARSEANQTNDSGPGTIGSGRAAGGQISEEATRAKEYKLETLVKMLDDYPMWQAIIHVGTYSTLEAVVMKLASRNWETLYLSPDMPPPQKKAILQQWRSSSPGGGSGPRFLVIFDVEVKPPEIPWSPLVINFDLPRSIEGYAHRAAAAVPASKGHMSQQQQQQQQPHPYGVIVSFVQAAGGDVEMLRSTECAYRFKSAEIPSVFHDLFAH